MCTGEKCPMKDKCYRFTAEPDIYQSYFAKPPIKGKKCEYQWPHPDAIKKHRAAKKKVK